MTVEYRGAGYETAGPGASLVLGSYSTKREREEGLRGVDVSRWGVGAPYSPSRVPLSGARFRGDRAGAAPGTGGGATWDPSSGARGDQGPPTRPTRVGGVGVEEVPLLRGPGGPGSPYSPYSGRKSRVE